MRSPIPICWARLSGLACASTSREDPQIWRSDTGVSPARIPGPIANFGPHEDFSSALQAACSLILSKPNATVAHLLEKDLALAKRTSKEYCAWLYYTPARQYELSMLTDMSAPGSELYGQASCRLPSGVDDPRYPLESLQHIFLLHNHPFAGEISRVDIHFAVDMARTHALVLGDAPSCDGFYQYVPATGEMLQWARSAGNWKKKRMGAVNWSLDGTFSIERPPSPSH